MSNTVESTPVDCVDLVLYSPSNHEPDYDFYLRIPISFIENHYTRPLKFLFYLGWCILGVMGNMVLGEERIVLLDAGHLQLQPGGRYYYRPEDNDDVFRYAVDLRVMKPKSIYNSSQSSVRDPDFVKRLLERDKICIFTSTELPDGVHIIFHSKGDEWIQFIVNKRPNDDVETDLESVDDVRNGMLATPYISRVFDMMNAIIIKTPNRILNEDDVAPRCERNLAVDVNYPTDVRYTFQYLKSPQREDTLRFVPDNNDAVFPIEPSAIWPKPSGLLLNYNFGAAAVHHWGQNKAIFENRPGIQRPEVKVADMGPRRTPGKENRENYATKKRKLEEEKDKQRKAGPSGTVQDRAEADREDEETPQEWDADDIVMFFWANSKAAKERQEHEEQSLRKSVEDWKSTLAVE